MQNLRATSIFNETIQQNPLLIGGLGLAIGMLIASALPPTDIEAPPFWTSTTFDNSTR